jgi:hypothetical protein
MLIGLENRTMYADEKLLCFSNYKQMTVSKYSHKFG